MFNPLEDEKFQLGVIALASISIVAFLTSIVSEIPPEISPPVRRIVAEDAGGNEPANSGGETVVESPRATEAPAAPVAPVVAAEDDAAPFPAALRLDMSAGGEGIAKATANPHDAGSKITPSLHRVKKSVREKAPSHVKPVMKRPIWDGPLPNKKSDAP